MLKDLLDKDEEKYAADNEPRLGDEESLFVTPTRKRKYAVYAYCAPYVVPEFEDLVRALHRSMIGTDDARDDLKEQIKNLFLTTPRTVGTHFAIFDSLLERYIDASPHGGPDPKRHVKWLLATIPSRIVEAATLSTTVQEAKRNVRDAIQLLRQRGTLKAKYSKVKAAPTVAAFVRAAPSTSGNSFSCPASSEPAVHAIVANLNNAVSSSSGCVLTAAAQVLQRELRPNEVSKMSADTYAGLHKGLQAGISRAHTATDVIASISHMLPSSYLKKVTRTTETTHSYDGLGDKSQDDLKSLFNKSKVVNKFRNNPRIGADAHTDSDSDDELSGANQESDRQTRSSSKKARHSVKSFTEQVVPELRSLTESIKAVREAPSSPLGVGKPASWESEVRDLHRTISALRSEVAAAPRYSSYDEQRRPRTPPGPNGGERSTRSPGGYSGGRSSSSYSQGSPGRHDGRPPVHVCEECGERGHYAGRCPKTFGNRDTEIIENPDCTYCKKNGHSLATCPVLAARVCKNCGQRGHNINFCPTVKCYKCGVKGCWGKRCEKSSKNGQGGSGYRRQ